MTDPVLQALSALTLMTVKRGEVLRGDRAVRWVEAGAGRPVVVFDAALGESGALAAVGILPRVALRTRVVAYDRAGIGASDPVSPLTLDGQIDDLAAVIEAAGAPCVVVGHSWGGMLAELVALSRPELVAGLVLLDPADEEYLASPGSTVLRDGLALGETVLHQYATGELPETVRDTFRLFAEQLSADGEMQAMVLDAHAWCYTKQTQAQMIQAEFQLLADSLEEIRRRRARSPLPNIPVVVLSATTGLPPRERAAYTSFHAKLVASAPRGEHIVLGDTSHAVNQERPVEVTDAILRVIEDL
jgi:pimeloyl-ACP methyl ester carboxylesterase